MLLDVLVCMIVRPFELSAAMFHALTHWRHSVEFVAVNWRFGLKCLTCEREFLNEDV